MAKTVKASVSMIIISSVRITASMDGNAKMVVMAQANVDQNVQKAARLVSNITTMTSV